MIKKSTPPAHSSTFVITRMIADQIGVHSVLFPLQTTDTQIVHGHRQTTKKLYVSFPSYPPKYKATIHMQLLRDASNVFPPFNFTHETICMNTCYHILIYNRVKSPPLHVHVAD